MRYFAPCPPGGNRVLNSELVEAGVQDITPGAMGVGFSGDLRLAYVAAIRLRTASRVLLQLYSGRVGNVEEFYEAVRGCSWEHYMDARRSIACRVSGVPEGNSPGYVNLKFKDGVVDRLREMVGQRPDVDRRQPEILLEARWDGKHASMYINWTGPSLSRRGYRLAHGRATLRETVAAILLKQAGWPEMARKGLPFVDPVCGSGTFLVEAAMMAADMAPGLKRTEWGFRNLKVHDDELWRGVVREAEVRFHNALSRMPRIVGLDKDVKALGMAKANLRRAGLEGFVQVRQHDLQTGLAFCWPDSPAGFVMADPPYGWRENVDPEPVYQAMGTLFRQLGGGWKMGLLAPNRKMASISALRAEKYVHSSSGSRQIVMALYNRISKGAARAQTGWREERVPKDIARVGEAAGTESKLIRALKKLLARKVDALGHWADKCGVTSFRIWDSDMPEFNVIVDWYERKWLHVQEFVAPNRITEERSRLHLNTLVATLREICLTEQVYVKHRRRGRQPYSKSGGQSERFIVRENGQRYFVNFVDYLDTGIFLDHRPTRAIIRTKAEGGSFLNLFCYTGTASVMAAAGGARRVVNVDISRTYLDWARDNMKLNSLDSPGCQYVRADAMLFMRENTERFNLIFIDPPTCSNGYGRDDWFIQDNHDEIIDMAMNSLKSGGLVIFSASYRCFKLKSALRKRYSFREITRETTDPDFTGRSHVHRCWEIYPK